MATTTTTTTRNCRECGTEFSVSDTIESFGRVFCSDKCREVAQVRQQAERDAQERVRRESVWRETVPPLYAATDPARLPQEQHTKVLAWQYGPKGLLLHGPTDVTFTLAPAVIAGQPATTNWLTWTISMNGTTPVTCCTNLPADWLGSAGYLYVVSEAWAGGGGVYLTNTALNVAIKHGAF